MGKKGPTKTDQWLADLDSMTGEFSVADATRLIRKPTTPPGVILNSLEKRGDLRRVRKGVYQKTSEFREILVNRFDFDEFIFFDGHRYWADGKDYAKLHQCHDLDGLDYGTKNVFEEIPRTDFDAVVRVLQAVEEPVAKLRSFANAIDRCSTAVRRSKRTGTGFVLIHSKNESLAQSVLDFCSCSLESWGGPDLLSTFYYLNTHVPHLEKPRVELPKAVSLASEPSIRYFQSKRDPFDLIPSVDGRGFIGTATKSALDQDSYHEIGPQAVRAIRQLSLRVRDDFQESRYFLQVILALAREVEEASSVRLSDAKVESALSEFLRVLPYHAESLHEFLEKMRHVRRHSVTFERALLRVARAAQDSTVRHLPGYYEEAAAA